MGIFCLDFLILITHLEIIKFYIHLKISYTTADLSLLIT